MAEAMAKKIKGDDSMADFKRSISESFFNNLYHSPEPESEEEKHESILHPFLERVWNDDTLNLEIRGKEVHIYHRGGTFLKIQERNDGTYKIELSENYYDEYYNKEKLDNLNGLIINNYEDSEECLQYFPYMKDAMDLHFNNKKRYERAYQQQIIRDNNHRLSGNSSYEIKRTELIDEGYIIDKKSNNSDYFIIDMEVTTKESDDERVSKNQDKSFNGQPDLFGVKWKSNSRPTKTNLDLSFIELKFKKGSYSGDSGIIKHYKDVLNLVKNKETMNNIKNELRVIFNQKRDLLILNNENHLESFSDDIEFILVLVNHKTNVKKSEDNETLMVILKELQKLHEESAPENLNLKIATSNFMGAALQKESVYEISEFINKFSDQISSN